MTNVKYGLPADCRIEIRDSLSKSERADWVRLFQQCFGGEYKEAKLIFQKYCLNNSRFSLLYYKTDLVACYAGIFVHAGGLSCFMSTDTMSNAQVRGGSVICANRIYESLIKDKVDLVFGYPNGNIRAIREQKLGWKYIKNLDLYLSLCCLDKTSKPKTDVQIVRPSKGFFKSVPFIFALSGYDTPSGAIFSLSLACEKPKSFCINLTHYFGIGRKTLYYKQLNPDLSPTQIEGFINLDFTNCSIDVP